MCGRRTIDDLIQRCADGAARREHVIYQHDCQPFYIEVKVRNVRADTRDILTAAQIVPVQRRCQGPNAEPLARHVFDVRREAVRQGAAALEDAHERDGVQVFVIRHDFLRQANEGCVHRFRVQHDGQFRFSSVVTGHRAPPKRKTPSHQREKVFV